MTEPRVPNSSHFTIFRSAAEEDVGRTSEGRAGDGDREPRYSDADWSLLLGVTMMRTLEYRLPGFIVDVQKRLTRDAQQMEDSTDRGHLAAAPSVRDLLASWVFTESSALAKSSDAD